jgi:glycosyltransferase involved in cell wall biosynthesis
MTPTLGTGTGLRTYGVTAALAGLGPVEVAYVPFGGGEPAPEYRALNGVRLRRVEASRGAGRALRYGAARLRGVPDDLARGISPGLVGAGRGVPDGTRLIADGPVAAAALLPAARRRPAVYLAHNLESGGFRGASGRRALARFERMVLRTFSEAWMATRADERGAVALAGDGVQTRYVPNVIDVEALRPVAPAGRAGLLFVGDFTYAPNREALDELERAVMPLVWEQRPDVGLAVIGRGVPEARRDRRIRTPGFVPDLRTEYEAADIALVPLLRGGGSPLKFVEALAYGLPVIATRHAASLLEDAQAGVHFVVAGDAREYAAGILSLVADPARASALAAAGRELVVERYSVQALSTLLTSERVGSGE